MSNEIKITELSIKAKAYDCHQRILVNANTAATAILEMAKSLKQMRDENLYIELGFESFKEYIENNQDYKFGERQAYNYIKIYEGLGNTFLQSTANLGITKLELLTKLPGYEREEFVANNDLVGMTVKEIEELIKKSQNLGEQISFLEKEKQDIICASELEKIEQDKEATKWKELADLYEKEITELKKKPVDVAVREPSKDEIKNIQIKAVEKARKEFSKTLEDEKQKIEIAFENKLKLQQEKALNEKAALEVQLQKGSADESKIAFQFYFKEIQQRLNNLVDNLNKIDDSNLKTKYQAGFKKFLDEIIALIR